MEPKGDVRLDESTLLASVFDFEEPIMHQRREGERLIQPAIHSTLKCAALSAETFTECIFTTSPEPIVYGTVEKLVADEAVYECAPVSQTVAGISVSHNGTMRVLVEVKGKSSFPYHFRTLSRFNHGFSQLIQESALALIQGLWKKELLIALATLDSWLIFQIIDKSDDECIKFTINNTWFHHYFMMPTCTRPLKYVSLTNVENIDEHCALISFLTTYLCTPI